jgi:hypothetical protein
MGPGAEGEPVIRQPEYGPDEYALLPDALKRQVLDMFAFQSERARQAEEEAQQQDRIRAQEQYAYEREEGVRRARMRREQERADGTLAPDAEAFRDLRLKPRVTEAHDFLPEVKIPIVQGLFFRDSLTWVAGQSGTFKSFVTADLAFRHGQDDMDFHGMRMTSGRSLLIVAEGSNGYAHRKTAWERQHGREVKNVSIYPAPLQLGDTLKEMPALISYLKEEEEAGRPFTLIVFDTQAMCTVGVDENTSEMNQVVNILHQLREVSGACVLVVHHFGKDKRAGMRGSSMIYAAADTVCVLKRKEDALDVVLSTAQADEGKQKDAETKSDFLTLEMADQPVGEDYFGDTVFSLVPVASEGGGSHDVHTEPADVPQSLPDASGIQMRYLKALNFFEKDGTSPSGLAYHMKELGYDTNGPLARNKMIELKKKGMAVQPVAKGPWFITPVGVAVIAQEIALVGSWSRPPRTRKGAGEGQETMIEEGVSEGVLDLETKPPAETSETSAKPLAKLSLTCDETSTPKNETSSETN